MVKVKTCKRYFLPNSWCNEDMSAFATIEKLTSREEIPFDMQLAIASLFTLSKGFRRVESFGPGSHPVTVLSWISLEYCCSSSRFGLHFHQLRWPRSWISFAWEPSATRRFETRLEIEIEHPACEHRNDPELSFLQPPSWKNGLWKADIKIHVSLETITRGPSNELKLTVSLIEDERCRLSQVEELREDDIYINGVLSMSDTAAEIFQQLFITLNIERD